MLSRRKRLIRREMKAKIAEASEADKAAWSRKIVEHFLSLEAYGRAQNLMAYFPLPDEPDITPLLETALDDGKRLYLPRIDEAETGLMAPVRVKVLDELVRGALGILEPAGGDVLEDLSELNLIIVPGRAFDTNGRRVGRGGGYYDRLLEKTPAQTKRIAAAFSCQVIDEVPHEEWDARVDLIITEDSIITP